MAWKNCLALIFFTNVWDQRKIKINSSVLVKTLSSPSCDGDLRLSCLEDHSRNRTFGKHFVQVAFGAPSVRNWGDASLGYSRCSFANIECVPTLDLAHGSIMLGGSRDGPGSVLLQTAYAKEETDLFEQQHLERLSMIRVKSSRLVCDKWGLLSSKL